MNDRTIGTCSLCGGAVTVPMVWMGVIPPTPTCSSCGAHRASHGPVIEMEQPYRPGVDPFRAPGVTTTSGG